MYYVLEEGYIRLKYYISPYIILFSFNRDYYFIIKCTLLLWYKIIPILYIRLKPFELNKRCTVQNEIILTL